MFKGWRAWGGIVALCASPRALADVLVMVCDEGTTGPRTLAQCQYPRFQPVSYLVGEGKPELFPAIIEEFTTGLPELSLNDAALIIAAAAALWGLVFSFRVIRKLIEES